MTRSFNLLDESWIPSLPRGSGQTTDKSLLHLVSSADQLREIQHPSPIVTLVLYRFIIAFLCAALRGPKNVTSLRTILDTGSFDLGQVGAYAQKWRNRFWLFDKEQPFLQDPTLATDGKPSPVFKLARETALASEKGKVHFDHTLGGSMSPAEAACYLLADQFFALQDGRGYSPSPLTFGAAVLVEGENLFETLALNLLVYNEESPVKSDLSADKPYWEQDSRDLSAFPSGWLDYVTRPYRRLLLVRSSRQDVTGVFRKSRVGLDKQWRAAMMDPWVAYSVSDKGNTPVRLREKRALWRDSHSLIQSLANRETGAPGYKNILARLNRQASLHVFGVVAGNNDVALWRHERLPLPTAYLTNDDLLQKLAEALKLGEDAAGRLSSAVWVLAEKALLRAFVDSLAAERPYWAALDVPFRGLMVDLADAWTRDEEHVPMRAWATAVRDAASKAFGSVARSLETSARGLRAAAEARGRFEASLNQLVGPYIKTQGEEETV